MTERIPGLAKMQAATRLDAISLVVSVLAGAGLVITGSVWYVVPLLAAVALNLGSNVLLARGMREFAVGHHCSCHDSGHQVSLPRTGGSEDAQ